MKMRSQRDAKSGGAKAKRALAKPAFKGWVTSDADEIEARRRRAETEKMKTLALAGAGIYGDFSITFTKSFPFIEYLHTFDRVSVFQGSAASAIGAPGNKDDMRRQPWIRAAGYTR